MPQSVASSSLSHKTGTLSSASRRFVRVNMLDRKELVIQVENKGARVLDIFTQVCQRVNLTETQYFGLAILKEGEFQFVSNDTKLQKLAPKVWKSKDCSVDEPLLSFHFRVEFYVDHIGLLKERATRLQYYLQLRDNLLHYSQSVSEEKCFMLAGYALQAEYGNFNVEKHTGSYFDPREFFPAWVVMRRGLDYITNHMPTIHRDLSGVSHAEACVQYIREVSVPPTQHNMHFYRLRRRKYDQLPGNVWLAICQKGLEVYEESGEFKSHYSTFLWPHIGKLSCDKKKFEIVADGFAERRFVYYAASKESGKSLLNICRGTHQFHLAVQPRMVELLNLEDRDRRGPHQEMLVKSENGDFSSLSFDKRTASDRGRASSIPAGGRRDRPLSSYLSIEGHAIRGASSPPSSSGYHGDTPGGSGRDFGQEIMIDTPPQVSSTFLSSGSSMITKVTPLSGDIPSSILWNSTTSNYMPEHHRGQLSGLHHGDQRTALSASSSIASLKPPNVAGRGSFIRSSASSNDGSIALANGRGIPFSLPKSSTVEESYNSPLVRRPDCMGQNGAMPRTKSFSINADSIKRNLRPGENLNDTVNRILEGDPSAMRSVPPRKSSLIYPRASALQTNDSLVVRSTSLRQPMPRPSNDAEQWPPQTRLMTALARSNLNLSPVPVPAQIHRIPFASPMTVMSNPVQSNVAIQPPVTGSGSGRHTPPYHVSSAEYRQTTATNETTASSVYAVGPLHSTPILRPHYHIPTFSSHTTIDNFSNATDNAVAATDSGGASLYHQAPMAYDDGAVQVVTGDFTNQSYVVAPENAIVGTTSSTNTPVLKQPPSYEASQSYRLAAVLSTPPTNHRFGASGGTNHGIVRKASYLSELSNGGVPAPNVVKQQELMRETSAYYPNGHVVGAQMLQQEVREGKMNGYGEPGSIFNSAGVVMASGTQGQGQGVPRARRQVSQGSVDSDDGSAQCPQHGSGIDIVEMVRNIGDQSFPFLKALCNDQTLLNSCTCRQQRRSSGDLQNISSASVLAARRYSLSQAPFTWEQFSQPGTVIRPNSWSSDLQNARLFGQITYDIDIDGGPESPHHPYANGVGFLDSNGGGRTRGLVHRHSDGASFQHAVLSRHGQLHSDSIKLPPTYIAA